MNGRRDEERQVSIISTDAKVRQRGEALRDLPLTHFFDDGRQRLFLSKEERKRVEHEAPSALTRAERWCSGRDNGRKSNK